MRSLLLTLALVLLAPLASRAQTAVVVTTTPVPLDTASASRSTVGKLRYLGGHHLVSDNPNFSGISGATMVGPDELMAITDRGHWLRIKLLLDKGRVTGVAGADLNPMRRGDGEPLAWPWSDAEEVVRFGDQLIVSFEQHHRLWRYPLGTMVDARPTPLPIPPALQRADHNHGAEAMVVLGDHLLVVREWAGPDGRYPGWRIGPIGKAAAPSFEELTYTTDEGLRPTAMVKHGRHIYVLERRYFEKADRTVARLVRFPAKAAIKGATITTTELARFGGTVTCDNYEALALLPLPGGGMSVLVISDDNQNAPKQRTLMLQFELP